MMELLHDPWLWAGVAVVIATAIACTVRTDPH